MSDEVTQIFKDAGAMLEGHFLLTSGLHSPVYWEKFRVLQHPQYTEQLCRLIVDHFNNQEINLVVGPTTGGIILAYEVARQLGIRGIFAEKEGDERVFRRGFTFLPGDHILIVDDILTTGTSTAEVIKAVNKLNGTIIGVGVLVDRSQKGVDLGIPLFSCLRAATQTYPAEKCPLCTAGIPLVKPGGQA